MPFSLSLVQIEKVAISVTRPEQRIIRIAHALQQRFRSSRIPMCNLVSVTPLSKLNGGPAAAASSAIRLRPASIRPDRRHVAFASCRPTRAVAFTIAAMYLELAEVEWVRRWWEGANQI